MNKKRFVLVVFAFVVPVLTGYYLFAVPPSVKPHDPLLATVAVRDLVVDIRTPGTLEAQNAHMISSQIKGTGAKIIYLAANGRSVAKGEVLIGFDAQPFEAAADELRGQVEHLTAAVQAAEQLVAWEESEAEQRIITAEFQHKVAKLDLRRLIEGEGPLKLAQLQDERDKAELALQHHRAYEADLQGMAAEGIAYPAELDRVRDDLKNLAEAFRSA